MDICQSLKWIDVLIYQMLVIICVCFIESYQLCSPQSDQHRAHPHWSPGHLSLYLFIVLLCLLFVSQHIRNDSNADASDCRCFRNFRS